MYLSNCSKSTVDEDDLEDGEIPSDEDDDTPMPEPPKVEPEPAKSSKLSEQRSKGSDSKFKGSSNNSNKKTSQSNHDRGSKFKPSEDWAGDVEKQLKAALEEDKNNKSQDKSNKNHKNNKRDKNRKRFRDDKEDEKGNKDDRNKVGSYFVRFGFLKLEEKEIRNHVGFKYFSEEKTQRCGE